jgi:hypothetical protein
MEILLFVTKLFRQFATPERFPSDIYSSDSNQRPTINATLVPSRQPMQKDLKKRFIFITCSLYRQPRRIF